MALQRQMQFRGGDAAAVVADADQLRAALLDVDLDPCRTGVEAVLDQLLDDRRRALDHLAGCDLIDEFAG